MPGPTNPDDAAEQSSSQSDARHEEAPEASGRAFDLAPPVAPAPGMGADAAGSDIRPNSSVKAGPDANSPHIFHLANWGGNVFDGGSLQGANEENWPILQNQQAAVYLARLEVGGIREPHWHPSAWEVNYVLNGDVRWVFVGPNGTQDQFTATRGDVIFAPQGHFHYFENASDTEELVVLIVFNSSATEPKDDIGIVQSLSALPTNVVSAVFGMPASVVEQIPKKFGRVVIARHPR